MPKRATTRPEGFKKPAHWTNDAPPAPRKGSDDEDLSPTRYGDWMMFRLRTDIRRRVLGAVPPLRCGPLWAGSRPCRPSFRAGASTTRSLGENPRAAGEARPTGRPQRRDRQVA
eukprot:jgi/Psemu1/30544/gm1.30544_g